MKNKLVSVIILVIAFFIIAHFAHAAATTLTQADFENECSNADFSIPLFSFIGSGCDMVSTRTHYTFNNAIQYYIQFDVDGNGAGNVQIQEGCGDNHTTYGDNTYIGRRWTIGPNSCVGDPYVQIAGGTSNWNSDSTALITRVCISDTSYAECDPPPPPPPATPTTTATSTATQNDVVFGLGIIIFILSTLVGSMVMSIAKT